MIKLSEMYADHEPKIGEISWTDVDISDDWWQTACYYVDIFAVSADPEYSGICLIRGVCGNGNLMLERVEDNVSELNRFQSTIRLGNTGERSYSYQFVKLEDVSRIFTYFDYKAGLDFIKVPKGQLSDSGYYIQTADGNMSFVSFSWDNTGRKAEVGYMYVGFLDHMVKFGDVQESLVGRFAYYINNVATSTIIKILQVGKRNHRDVVYYLDCQTMNPTIETSRTIVLDNSYTDLDSRELILLDIVDEDLARNGARDINGNYVMDSIVLDGKDSDGVVTLKLKGNTVISGNGAPCITTYNVHTLIIEGNGNPDCMLKLFGDSQQPCIGVPTHTGMSYGRWSPCNIECSLERIICKCNVGISSQVPHFSIGSYNYAKYPKIEVDGDYSIYNCPELEGERVLTVRAEPPSGSTKISMLPTYDILKAGEKFTSEQMVYIEEIEQYDKSIVDKLHCHLDMRMFKLIAEMLEFGYDPRVDTLLEYSDKIKDYNVASGVLVLGLPKDVLRYSEVLYEDVKVRTFLPGKKNPSLDDFRELCLKKFNNRKFSELTLCEQRYVFEMIPTYQWNFCDSRVEDARRFYNEDYATNIVNLLDTWL